MIRFLLNLYRNRNKEILKRQAEVAEQKRKSVFFELGQIPWADWYQEHKKEQISLAIYDQNLLKNIALKVDLPKNYGYRIDERIVEYAWIMANLPIGKLTMLDAGSTFNFDYLVKHPQINEKDLTIFTYYPEQENYASKRISYVYGDLRDLYFKEKVFDIVVCQSTIEHIDMDNSMYGYDLSHNQAVTEKSYQYLTVVDELLRVTKNGGTLLLTFPYGRFENHGFFQQFDEEMVARITDKMQDNYSLMFFEYLPDGWVISSQEKCNQAESYNPHTGKGKKDDFAAHSRAICCIKYKI
jgi:SAM-dependent methyltransferase